MWKRLKLFFNRQPRKRRINMNQEEDYECLKQAMQVKNVGSINLDEWDLLQLKAGEAVFLWESPLAASVDEAAAMAGQAAKEMTPAPGCVILTAILLICADSETGLETIDKISKAVQACVSEKGTFISGVKFCDGQKGDRFIFATAEGKLNTKPKEPLCFGKENMKDGGIL